MTAPPPRARHRAAFESRWFPVAAYAVLTVIAFFVITWTLDHLSLYSVTPPNRAFPHQPWFDGWVRWDAGWYNTIATHGYTYTKGVQSPVAFFPAYPLLMRAASNVFGTNVLQTGIVITVVCGLGTAVVFHRWCRLRLDAAGAAVSVLVFLLYPYTYYLFGSVYADSVFLLFAIGAFLLAEHDHMVLAGLAGAVATAARPVGGALVIGLIVLVLTRRQALVRRDGERGAKRFVPVLLFNRLRAGDAGVLLSAAGLAAYCVYLWVRFDAPLAFVDQTGVPGWDQSPGPATWFKIDFFREMTSSQSAFNYVRFLAQAGVTVAALLLVWAIVRRFGWAYGSYALVIVVIPALSTKDFTGMGRYVLAAFPCFAALGGLLTARPRLAVAVLAASACGLLLFTSAFARGYYIS
jgi:hypothetical protein